MDDIFKKRHYKIDDHKPSSINNAKSSILVVFLVVLCCILVVMNVSMHQSLQVMSEVVLNLQHEVKSYKAVLFNKTHETSSQDDFNNATQAVLIEQKPRKSTDYIDILKGTSHKCNRITAAKCKSHKLEEDIQIATQSSKLLHDFEQYRMPTILEGKDKLWSLLLMLSSYSHDDKVAPVIFKMSNISDNMNCGHSWVSRPFFAFDKGYKMCLVVYGGGYGDGRNSHLSVSLYLMKGPYDDQLEQSGHWPLNGVFKIELLNQMNDYLHYTTHVKFNSTACSKCTNRVLQNDIASSGWGNPLFITHDVFLRDNIIYTNFIRNDSIYFRVSSYSADGYYNQVVLCILWSVGGTVAGLFFMLMTSSQDNPDSINISMFIADIVVGIFIMGSFWIGTVWGIITCIATSCCFFVGEIVEGGCNASGSGIAVWVLSLGHFVSSVLATLLLSGLLNWSSDLHHCQFVDV